jgi:hypothetical protein
MLGPCARGMLASWQVLRCLQGAGAAQPDGDRVAEHATREPEKQQAPGVARAEPGAAVQERGSGAAAELLLLQRAAGNRAVGRLVDGAAPAGVQRRIEAYNPGNFAETRAVDAREALEYLTARGGNMTEGQQRWLAEVKQKLQPKTLEDAVTQLERSAAVVEFADHQPNSAAVALLSALEKLAPSPTSPKLPSPETSMPTPKSLVESKRPILGERTEKSTPQPSTRKKKPVRVAFDFEDQTSEFHSLGANGVLDPRQVKFSQDTAGFKYSDSFKMGGRTIVNVEDHSRAMVQAGDGRGTPAIEIVLYRKRIMTLNNRRLKAHQLAGIAIPYVKSRLVDEDAISRHPNVDGPAPRNNLTLR